jgi:hypothetical protein
MFNDGTVIILTRLKILWVITNLPATLVGEGQKRRFNITKQIDLSNHSGWQREHNPLMLSDSVSSVQCKEHLAAQQVA